MRTIRVMVILLVGLLLALVACAPASVTPTTPTPTPTPTPTTPTPTPTPTPAGPAAFTDGAFTISDMRIEFGAMGMAEPGDDVKVVVKVMNTGGQQGTYTLVLKVDGTTVKTQDVTLAGGASQRVTFYITAHDGIHTVIIGNLTGTLEVPAS